MPYFMLFNIKYLDIAIFWKPSIVFFVKTLACLKYLRTFAPLLTKSTSEKKFWRGGRVVDCGGLENRCTARYPGFESLSLRFRYSEMNIREKPKKNVSIIATSSYDTFLLYPS